MQLRFQKKKMKAKIINMEFLNNLISGILFDFDWRSYFWCDSFSKRNKFNFIWRDNLFLNSISGFLAIEFAFKKSQNTF